MQSKAIEHVSNILLKDMELEKRPESRVLLVFDTDSPLSSELSQAYISAIEQHNIPATIIEFDPENTRPIWDAVESANPDDVAVLVQTGSFRLDEFRFRLVLYRHGFRVVEHPHLGHNAPDQTETYIDTLTYDMPHFEAVFQQCQNLFNGSKKTVIRSTDGSVLEYSGTMDKVLANTGDFSAAEKKWARYPIGEVFTEALDLQCLNGTMLCFAYPDTVRHETHWPQQPFQIFVEQGIVVGHNGPQEFQDLLDVIRTEDVEDRVWVREFGLGLNRNVTGRLNDVSSYERREGIHFSLGLKHNIYRKKFGKKVLQRFHIDIFIDAQEVVVDDTVLFQKEEWFIYPSM